MVAAGLLLVVMAGAGALALAWALSWPLWRPLDPAFEQLARQVPRPLPASRLQRRVLNACLRHVSVGINGGVLAPTSYEVHLAPEDVEVLGGLTEWFARELSGALADKVAERGAPMPRPPAVTIVEDDGRPRSRPRVAARFEPATELVAPPAPEVGQSTVVAERTVVSRTWALVPVGPGGEGGAIGLTGTDMVVGRSRGADVTLDDATVSGRHARLRLLPDGRWEVTDLGSTNGTHVNGHKLQAPAVLDEGDEVRIGAVTWRLSPA